MQCPNLSLYRLTYKAHLGFLNHFSPKPLVTTAIVPSAFSQSMALFLSLPTPSLPSVETPLPPHLSPPSPSSHELLPRLRRSAPTSHEPLHWRRHFPGRPEHPPPPCSLHPRAAAQVATRPPPPSCSIGSDACPHPPSCSINQRAHPYPIPYSGNCGGTLDLARSGPRDGGRVCGSLPSKRARALGG